MTTLDGNAITQIERLVSERNEAITIPGEAKGVYYLRDADGSLTRYRAELDNHDVTAYDLAAVQAHAETEDGAIDGIYVTDQRVITQSSDAHHRWQTRLDLPHHPAFAHLLNWRRLTPLTQKELVRLLRTELRDHVDPTVISTFSSLKFTNNSEGTSTVRPTSSALNTSIRQQVATARGEDAPETIAFRVPVYDIPEARGDAYDVTVYVEYDHEKGAFLLLAVHSDLRDAQERAVLRIIGDLRDRAGERYPVLYGKPS